MSWKGLTKAVQRLPHQLRAKSGHAEVTADYEYDDMEAAFKALDLAAKKLNDDAKKFRDSLAGLLNHQAEFGNILSDVYLPLSGRAGRQGNDGEVGGHGMKRAVTPPQSLKSTQDFARVMAQVKEDLTPELELITRRVVQPTSDYITLIEAVKKMMTKRAHKLVDYDRHRLAVKSLKEKTDKTTADEKELGKRNMALDQATREYENVNNLLKQQLPVFLDLRVQFIDPCFQTLFWYQLKVYTCLTNNLYGLVGENFDARVSAESLAQAAGQRCTDLLSQISLIRAISAQPAPQYNPGVDGDDDGTGAGRNSVDSNGGHNPPPPYDNGSVASVYPSSSSHVGGIPRPNTSPTKSYNSASYNNNNNYNQQQGQLPMPTMAQMKAAAPYAAAAAPYAAAAAPHATPYIHAAASQHVQQQYGVKLPPAATSAAVNAAVSSQSSLQSYGNPARDYSAAPSQPRQQQNRVFPSIKYVVALYDFDGQQDGDLVFRKGDRIEVVEKTGDVNDWWTGKLRGSQGQFPGNYVEDA
ncbi:hypothetical protein SmJEL517_g04559 [Synchytrium microbalum]|uniref:SH3 domain-containing protein n=1 Tax=Synchytrium microbalum TaxID=1806994 RepID=A0A507BYU9_9FUNG|nr:uncharacterized protein SmJEL517_g04559 [Synchytrium microbalum]TPX32298.1 hypothetical protein SmJEL517_g04559 [Synchytrium microbalum]